MGRRDAIELPDRARLRLGDALPVREPRAGRRRLHHAPELRAGELAERPSGPRAEAKLPERRPDANGQARADGEGTRRLAAAFERARVDRRERKGGEPLREALGLLLARRGEVHVRGPSRELLAGGVRQGVADEQEEAHEARSIAPRSEPPAGNSVWRGRVAAPPEPCLGEHLADEELVRAARVDARVDAGVALQPVVAV